MAEYRQHWALQFGDKEVYRMVRVFAENQHEAKTKVQQFFKEIGWKAELFNLSFVATQNAWGREAKLNRVINVT